MKRRDLLKGIIGAAAVFIMPVPVLCEEKTSGSLSCVPASYLIETESGLVKIGDLKPGATLTFYGANGTVEQVITGLEYNTTYFPWFDPLTHSYKVAKV